MSNGTTAVAKHELHWMAQFLKLATAYASSDIFIFPLALESIDNILLRLQEVDCH